MALKRPEPKTFSQEDMQSILSASSQQTGKAQVVRSWDKNFPVFEVPINQKILAYVPNHTTMDADGSVVLRWDKFAAHAVIVGRSYDNVRCTSGLVSDAMGWDGTCPLCESRGDIWDLYHKEYAEIAKSKGIDINSPEAETALKQDRTDLLKSAVIKDADVWYTFPIVVIECETDAQGNLTTKPKLDVNKQMHGTPMFYSIRERQYNETWKAGFDSIENADGEVPTSPAGLWAVLNFTYTPKSGNHDRMGSARALKVTYKTMAGFEEWASAFDNMTNEWTPAKAAEVVVLDSMRTMDEMREANDQIMKPVRDKLAMYELGAGTRTGVAPTNASAESTLQNFGATEVAGDAHAIADNGGGEMPQQNLTSEMPNMGV